MSHLKGWGAGGGVVTRHELSRCRDHPTFLIPPTPLHPPTRSTPANVNVVVKELTALDKARARLEAVRRADDRRGLEGYARVVELIQAAGAATLEHQLREGRFAGLREDDVEAAKGLLGCDAEAAGLALFVCKCQVSRLQERLRSERPALPSPGDVVSMDNMRKHQWLEGIVVRGRDFQHGDEVDGGAGWPGIMCGRPDAKNGTVTVFWPMGTREDKKGNAAATAAACGGRGGQRARENAGSRFRAGLYGVPGDVP